MFEVSGETTVIKFGATGMDEIEQNIRTILTTTAGSVPLERAFGIDYSALDEPQPIAKARMTNRIVRALRDYEPRIEVESVRFDRDSINGRLTPIVRFKLDAGVIV